MPGVMEMLRHVLGRRAVAAQCGAAGLTGTQMHPPAIYFLAFLASQLTGDLNLLNIFYMLTSLSHYTSLKYWWTKLMDIDPSPTADVTRFIAPARTSPAAKMPGELVSSR
jgi:hypothetical protein